MSSAMRRSPNPPQAPPTDTPDDPKRRKDPDEIPKGLVHKYLRWLLTSVTTATVAELPEEDGGEEASDEEPLPSGTFRADFFLASLLAFCFPFLCRWFTRRFLANKRFLFKFGFYQMYFAGGLLYLTMAIVYANPDTLSEKLNDGFFVHLVLFNFVVYLTSAVLSATRYSYVEGGILPADVKEEHLSLMKKLVPTNWHNPLLPGHQSRNKLSCIFLWFTLSCVFASLNIVLLSKGYLDVQGTGVFEANFQLKALAFLSMIISFVSFRHIAFIVLEVVHGFRAHVFILKNFSRLNLEEHFGGLKNVEQVEKWLEIRAYCRSLDKGRHKALEQSAAVVFLVNFALVIFMVVFIFSHRFEINIHSVRISLDCLCAGMFSLLLISSGAEFHSNLKSHRGVILRTAMKHPDQKIFLKYLDYVLIYLEETSKPIQILTCHLSNDLWQRVFIICATLCVTHVSKFIKFH